MDGFEVVDECSVQIEKNGVKRAHEDRRFGLATRGVTGEVRTMSSRSETTGARVSTRVEGDVLEVAVAGRWQITEPRPNWAKLIGRNNRPTRIALSAAEVEQWDSSLLLFLFEVQEWCRAHQATCDITALPEKIRVLLAQLVSSHEKSVPVDRSENFVVTVGLATKDAWLKLKEIMRFVGETVLGAAQLAKSPQKFRWHDCIDEMLQCGAMALPIVSLISFLVGVTLAYTGAIVLRQYGGDIFIADLIGLSMVRETGAVMTAVVLAGRTGAAFAATLANMKANEEIDALEVLGIRPVQFLVLPRMVALTLMMPLLALYANALGILGGGAVALGLLSISPSAYWVEMLTSLDMSDLAVGLIKATSFGVIVGVSGCLRGLQAERSASGVGRAATSAVVTALLLLVVADAVFAVLFNILNW
jgi:phospholipid/cholesterol/gamma-HCH transport system permease protein